MLELANYWVETSLDDLNDPTWAQNIMSRPGCSNLPEITFEEKSVVTSGLIGLGFGAYLGLLLYAKNIPEAMRDNSVQHDVEETSCGARLGRLCLAILVLALVAGTLFIGIGYLYTPSSIYLVMLLKTLLPATFSGLYVFYLQDQLLQCCSKCCGNKK